jgi:hypothetical protein
MKQRPNISVQPKSNTKLEYLKYLATENIQPNISVPTVFIPKGKTKSKPKLNVVKGIDINKSNELRISLINFAINEQGITPDLLIEYNDKYVLTITSYKLLTNNETPTAKDLDVYCDGLLVDKTTYDVIVGENIVITIQKSEAVDDTFDTNNFEIVGSFNLI